VDLDAAGCPAEPSRLRTAGKCGEAGLRRASLAVFLFGFWLALSGHYTVMLVGIGAMATAFCLFVAHRAGSDDPESHPTHLFIPALTYFPWLVVEIAKSAWAVTRIILDPKLPISPTMTAIRALQKTSVGIAAFGNSITLTPGTITTNVRGNELIVHALVKDGADDLEEGTMNRRVQRFEGGA
jgi:multicomponent Na+:H+ antiporter subunit E